MAMNSDISHLRDVDLDVDSEIFLIPASDGDVDGPARTSGLVAFLDTFSLDRFL